MRHFKDLGGNSYSTQDKQNFCPYFKDQCMEFCLGRRHKTFLPIFHGSKKETC